jgi:hypothetical protein
MAAQGAVMRAQQAREKPSVEPKPLCEGISRGDEPCNSTATVLCEKCGRWFCAAHAQDDAWHGCVLQPGEEGGEG